MFTISRRGFLSGLAASTVMPLFANQKVPFDPTLIALVSDTHLCGNPKPEYQRLAYQKVVKQILALNPRPAYVLNYGDFAYLFGKKCDYEIAKKLTDPLEQAGIKLIVGMGNHDRRATFLEQYPRFAKSTKVSDRIVSILETPNVDFIMLDSCLEGPVNGAIDPDQLGWLEATLKNYNKPVFIGSHHDPWELKLEPILNTSPMVAGYIYGHHHHWADRKLPLDAKRKKFLQTACLPSTGFWGDIGYALMHTTADRAVLALHQNDCYYPRPKPVEERDPIWDARLRENQGKTVSFTLPAKQA